MPLRSILALVLLASSASCARTPEKPLETIEFAGYTFREVRTLAGLPVVLKEALGVDRQGDEMADRGESYNSSDVVVSRVPFRRFAVAGLDKDAAIVAFEQGGFVRTVRVVLYSGLDKNAIVERECAIFDTPSTLRDLVDRLNALDAEHRATYCK